MQHQRALRRLFVVVLALTAARHAEANVGTVTITPTSGPVGTIVQVHVSGFTGSPSNPSGTGSLYTYEILFDGLNFGYPGVGGVTGGKVNSPQPFVYALTIPANLAPGSTHTIDYSHSGNDTSTPAIFTVTGPASKIVLISGTGQTLMTGATSSPITAQLRDAFDTPVLAAVNGTTLTLTKTSTAGTFLDANGFSTGNLQIPNTANSASFSYRDTSAGMPTLTVAKTGLTSATTTFTINPPPPTVPAAPSKVTATAVSYASVHVSWASSPGATGYYVFGATSAAGPFAGLNASPVTTSPYIQTGLTPNKQYFYKVKANNTAGTSAAFSPVDSATTPSPVLTGNTTVSDSAKCAAIGGTFGASGGLFVGGNCAVSSLTIDPAATLTIHGLTLVNNGTIDNAGTINIGVSNAGPGGVIFNKVGSTISNGGAMTNYYGSTMAIGGAFNQWCAGAFNNTGSWSPSTLVDACPGSTIYTAASPSQQVVFMAAPGKFSAVTAIPESSLPNAGKPTGLSFPFGFFGWTVTGVAPGQTVTVRMKFASNVPASSPYWRVVNGQWRDLTPLVGDNDGDNMITLTIKDDGLEDADAVPGQVSDPGGFGGSPPPVTMSSTTIAMVLVVMLLVFTNIVSFVVGRRRDPRPPVVRG